MKLNVNRAEVEVKLKTPKPVTVNVVVGIPDTVKTSAEQYDILAAAACAQYAQSVGGLASDYEAEVLGLNATESVSIGETADTPGIDLPKSFGMFTDKGDAAVWETIADVEREYPEADIHDKVDIVQNRVATDPKFGEVDDTAVREALYNYFETTTKGN